MSGAPLANLHAGPSDRSRLYRDPDRCIDGIIRAMDAPQGDTEYHLIAGTVLETTGTGVWRPGSTE